MANTENVVTFRCSDDLLEEIDAATDASRFDTRAAFLRWHLEETVGKPIRSHTDANRKELSERIDELETGLSDVVDRLESIESESYRPEPTEVGANRIESSTSESLRDSERQSESSHDSARDGEEIDAALEGFRPGRGPEEREPRRESAHAVLQWLRDQQAPVTAADVKHALYDTHGVEGQTEQTWWEMTVRRAFQQAETNGYVDIDGRTYKWTGE